jgi:hypothetical protein
MSVFKRWIPLLLTGSLLLAACSPAGQAREMDLDGLALALSQAGGAVQEGGEVSQEFFQAPGRLLRVNEAEVQVFQYASVEARQSDSSLIGPGGSEIGTMMVTWVDRPNFWASGRLIVLYVGQDEAVISLLSQVLGDPIAQGAGPGLPPPAPAAVEAARLHLAQALGLAPEAVEIVSYEAAEWPNACLGLPGPDEMCAEVITPGLRVVLQAGGEEHIVRTDQSGMVIRSE